MHIDTGLVVIIIAALFFYLRLILLQRERAKRAAYQFKQASKKKGKSSTPSLLQAYSIISTNKRDWIIAGSGILFILIGVLLNLKAIPVPLAQVYWWLPVALGIVAFSWGFR
jgi:hypothetical protein